MWWYKDDKNVSKEVIEERYGTSIEMDKVGVNDMEIREWNMELRENMICMDEQNVKVKKKRMEVFLQTENERSLEREKTIEEKENELSLQQEMLEATIFDIEQTKDKERKMEVREEEILLQLQSLNQRESDMKKKNILEINLRMNAGEQKTALQVSNIKTLETNKLETELMVAREMKLEEKEEELFTRERNLEEREFEIEDRKSVLQIATRVDDFRKANIQFPKIRKTLILI